MVSGWSGTTDDGAAGIAGLGKVQTRQAGEWVNEEPLTKVRLMTLSMSRQRTDVMKVSPFEQMVGCSRSMVPLARFFIGLRVELGAPKSCERFLCSTAFGCYQAFDAGFAIWEGGEDIGFPLLESLIPLRRQMCIVAFFDLRGFTSWSKDATPEEVQQAIQAFEASIHDGFSYESAPWVRLFLKGTGDGVMIVSQADWYKGTQLHQRMIEFARGHAIKFLHACEQAVLAGRARLAHYNFPLAIGCGIASGELDRVFLFGRFDFIGPAANEAAKLQQHAWNEICVTREFGTVLNTDGRSLDAEWVLATKGWRLHSLARA